MNRLETWVQAHPRTCIYLVVVSTLNLLMNVAETFR